MATARCVFCGRQEDDFKGTYLIKNDGSVNYYCSSKCNKNHLKLKRDKRRLKWTSAFHEARVKRSETEKRNAEKANETHSVEHKKAKKADR